MPETLASPDCPRCGHPPVMIFFGTQAFCGNEDCQCLCWNPTRTPAANNSDVSEIDASDLNWSEDV